MNNATAMVRNTVLVSIFSMAALAMAFVFVPVAHAQFDDGGGPGDGGYSDGGGFDGGGYTGGDWSGYGPGDSGSCDFGCGGYTGGDWSGYGPGDSGSCTYGCASDYGSYGTQDYANSGYDSGYNSSYYPSSYSSSYPSSYIPSYASYSTPMYYQPAMPSNTNVNTNVNTNTCTNGSCNTNVSSPTTINAPTTIAYPPTYQQPTYAYNYPQTCTTCGCNSSYCYTQPTYNQPIAYNNPAPYVSLSAVPYTGLDLGPWGTALYWGFLIAWCLLAAYLIVVKRVHNTFVAWLTGSPAQQNTTVREASAPVAKTYVAAPAQKAAHKQFAGIDPFIASQINRAAF